MLSIVRILMILLGLVGVAALVGLIIGLVQLLTKKKPDTTVDPNTQQTHLPDQNSYFDGNTIQLIGIRILSGLLSGITLGLAYPWAMCMRVRWEVKHTIINGRRLRFTGTGGQLFGRYLLWAFLTVITLGIYGIWYGLGMKKWVVKHTVYEDDPSPAESCFTGGAGGYFAMNLLYRVFCIITLGFGSPWAKTMYLRWEAKHTHIGGTQLIFKGTGVQFIGQYLLLLLLTPITLGIYALCFPVKLLKWQYKHTQAAPIGSPAALAASGGISGGVLMGICGGALAFVLVIFAVIALFIPVPSNSPQEAVRQTIMLHGNGNCVLSYRDANALYKKDHPVEDYRQIVGEDFCFDQDIGYRDIRVLGTIGTAALLDADTDTLYLDFAVEETNIDLYLTLDEDQTGNGKATALTGLIRESSYVSSMPYDYENVPRYVTVMGMIKSGGNYQFVVIHRQDLEVTVGATKDPSQEESQPTVNSNSIVGQWQYIEFTSYIPNQAVHGGNWTFYADGTFSTYDMGYIYTQDQGWSGAMGAGEDSGTYTYDGTTLTMHYSAIQSPDGWSMDAHTETEIVKIDGNMMSISDSRYLFMLKDSTLEEVLSYIDNNQHGPVGTWFMIGQPQKNDIDPFAHAQAGYYVFAPNGSFYYMSLTIARSSDGWYFMGGGEDSCNGTWTLNGDALNLHYTVHHDRYYDEQAGYERSMPVECSATETYHIDFSGTQSQPFTHDRLGQLAAVQKNTDPNSWPVDAMIQYCNANF